MNPPVTPNPEATTAINRYVESTDTRPNVDAFNRLDTASFDYINEQLLRAEDNLNLLRGNSINISRLAALGLPPGGRTERYFVAPPTATLKLKQGGDETTIPADGTERTVAGIVIKRLRDPEGGRSIIEMRANTGQSGARSFEISGDGTTYPAINFEIRNRVESQAQSYLESRQQMMTAAMDRLGLEQQILSASTDRTQRQRAEANMARLRELNLKLTADQARDMDIFNFMRNTDLFIREYNEYVRAREGEPSEAARQRVAYRDENRATIEALNEQLRMMTTIGEVHSWSHTLHRHVQRREDDSIRLPEDAVVKKMADVLAWLDRNADPSLPPTKADVETQWNNALAKIRAFRTTQNDTNRAEVDAAFESLRSILLQTTHRIPQQRAWLDAGNVGPAFGDIFGVARDPSVRVHTTDVSVNGADNVELMPAIGNAVAIPRAGRQRITVPAGELKIGGTALANGTSRTVGSFTFQRSGDGLTLTVSSSSLSNDAQQNIAIRTSADGADRNVSFSFRGSGVVQPSTLINALRTGLFIQRHRTVCAATRQMVSSNFNAVPEAIGLTPGYPRHAITNLPVETLRVNGTNVAANARNQTIGNIKVTRTHEGRVLWVQPADLAQALNRHGVTVAGTGVNITTHINFAPGAGDRGANPIRDSIEEARTIRRQYFTYDQEVLAHRLQTNELLTLQGNLHALPMPEHWNGALGLLAESADGPYRTALEAWLRDASPANTNTLRDNMNRILRAAGLPETVTADNVQSHVESSRSGSVDALSRSRNQAYLIAIAGWLRGNDATTAGALVTAANGVLRSQRPPAAEVAAAANIERLMRVAGCGQIGMILRSSIDRNFTEALRDWKEAPTNADKRDLLVAQSNRILLEIRPPITPPTVTVANLVRVMDLAGLRPAPAIPGDETVLIGNLRRKLGETTAETLTLRNAYNKWLIRHTDANTTALVTACNAALGRSDSPYATAANIASKLEMAGSETREGVMRGSIGVISLATYHTEFNQALTAYVASRNHLTTQRMFEKINLVLADAGMPAIASTSQVAYLLGVSGRLPNIAGSGSTESVAMLQREIELARMQSFDTLNRYYEQWNGRLERGATVQELAEHLLTMGGVMRNDPFAELADGMRRNAAYNWKRAPWDISPIGLGHSLVNLATGRAELSSTTHVRNGNFYGIRGDGILTLATPTSEAATILQAQGVSIDGFDEASPTERAEMVANQVPNELRETLLQIRKRFAPRLTGTDDEERAGQRRGAISLASTNHQLLNTFAGQRPMSRLTGAPLRPPENRPSDYEKVALLTSLRRTIMQIPQDDRIYLEGQAHMRIAAAGGERDINLPPNLDGTPAGELTGLPAWVSAADGWPANEGEFEALDAQKAVYAYVVLMDRFRGQASTRAQVQTSIDALPALSDVRTNDDAAGQSMGMYRYLLDRQAVLQETMRLAAQDYTLACARAVELHIAQAQTNHANQGGENMDFLLLAAGIAQFGVYGVARNIYTHGWRAGLWRSHPLSLRNIARTFTWWPQDLVVQPARGANALRRVLFGSREASNTGRLLTATEAVNLQRNINRVRDIATELNRLRGAHADEIGRITKSLRDGAITETEAARQIAAAQRNNGQLVRQLHAERTNLGRNIAASLDGVSDATRTQWARALMGGEDAVRALGRSPQQLVALERGIIEAHNIGRGQQLTDLAVDASRNPIMRNGRQLNVRDAKWQRLAQAFEEAGMPIRPQTGQPMTAAHTANRNLARSLMDGACGEGRVAARATNMAEAVVAGARAERALVIAAVRGGRMTIEEGRALLTLIRAGRLTQDQWRILNTASRAGELDEAAVVALRATTGGSRFGAFLHATGNVLAFAGIAFDSYILMSETAELLRGRERIRNAMGVLAKQLTDANFVAVGDVNPETGVAMKYRHSESGFTIDIDNMQSQLQWINATEHGGRMLSAGVGIGLFVTSMAVGGPIGLAIAIGGAIITIVITTVAEAWSDYQRAKFLHDAPPFLFMVWSSAQALGKPTHEMMKSLKEVSWWRHIVLGRIESIRDDAVQAMYPTIEKKLAFQLLKEELSGYSPAALQVLLSETGGVAGFDTFYDSATGFDRIYEYWAEELGAITGKNMADRSQRADAVGQALPTRRAMRYAVARHMIRRNAEQRTDVQARLGELTKLLAGREPVTMAQVQPYLRYFPPAMRAQMEASADNPGFLRQQLEQLINDFEIQSDMLTADNVDVNAMDGAWRTNMTQRMRLYRAAFKDPVICHQLQHEYNDVEEEGSPNAVGSNLLNAVQTTQLVASGLPQDNFELARMHLLNLGGRRRDIDSLLSARVSTDLAKQQLTSHISRFVGNYPSTRFGRYNSATYFPHIREERDRPTVYVSFPDHLVNGAERFINGACVGLSDIRNDFPGLTDGTGLKIKAVAFNVLPITALRYKRRWKTIGERLGPGSPYETREYRETHYLLNATYYMENKQGDAVQTIIGNKSAYLYQNPRMIETTERSETFPRENTTQWYVHNGAMQLSDYQSFLGDRANPNRANRQLDALVNDNLRDRMTNDAIARSEERYGPRMPEVDRPERFRRVEAAEKPFQQNNRMAVFVSARDNAAHTYTFSPTSPEYALCLELSNNVHNNMAEADPQAVFLEFERVGNQITALATYFNGTTLVRRRAARATIRSRRAYSDGERQDAIDGVVHVGNTMHGIDINRVSAIKHFVLNGGLREEGALAGIGGGRTTNLWEAAMPPMGLSTLDMIHRTVKRRNRERIDAALAYINADIPPGTFVPAGNDEYGRAQYIMYLPGADSGSDAYVLKSVRLPSEGGALRNGTIRVGGETRNIQFRMPDDRQRDVYTYHSRGDLYDTTASFSNINELLGRHNYTFRDREVLMRMITGSHDRNSDGEPSVGELMRFLQMFPTEVRLVREGPPRVEDTAAGVLAVRLAPLYEAAEDKRAFLWEVVDRIRERSSQVVLFSKLDDILRDIGKREVPDSGLDRIAGSRNMAFQMGPNEYAVQFIDGETIRNGIISESAVSRPYRTGTENRRVGDRTVKTDVRRYGSSTTVARMGPYFHEWSLLNYFRDRTGDGKENRERREILERMIFAPSRIENPERGSFAQARECMRPVNRILDGWLYTEACFDVNDQFTSGSDGRQRFAGIIGRIYMEVPQDRRSAFLRALFEVMETVDGSDGQNDAILSHDWRTTNPTDITRELDGARLCLTFQSIIMEMRRRFPLSDEQRSREALASIRPIPGMVEMAYAPASEEARITTSGFDVNGQSCYAFIRTSRQTGTTNLRTSAMVLVPALNEANIRQMTNWSAESPTLEEGVTARDGIAGPTAQFRIREPSFQSTARRINLTNAAPSQVFDGMGTRPIMVNDTMVAPNAANVTIGPIKVTRTSNRVGDRDVPGDRLTVTRVNEGADLADHTVSIVYGGSLSSQYSLSHIRYLRTGVIPDGARVALTEYARNTWSDRLAIPVEKRVGKLLNGHPLRQIIEMCSREFDRERGIDRKYDLYRGLSELYWRATDQRAFLVEFVRVMSGEQEISNGSGGNIRVDGVIREANIPRIVAHMTARFPMPAVAPAFTDPPESAARGTPEYLRFQINGLRTRMAGTAEFTREQVVEMLERINETIGGTNFTEALSFDVAVGDPIALRDRSEVILRNESGQLALYGPDPVRKATLDTWRSIINAGGGEDTAASLPRRLPSLRYLLKAVHALGQRVAEIDDATPKRWRLPNQLLALTLTGEDTLAFEEVAPPTVDGLYAPIRDANENGRWEEVDAACGMDGDIGRNLRFLEQKQRVELVDRINKAWPATTTVHCVLGPGGITVENLTRVQQEDRAEPDRNAPAARKARRDALDTAVRADASGPQYGKNLADAIAAINWDYARTPDGEREAFVKTINDSFAAAGLPVRIRANGDALERAPDFDPVRPVMNRLHTLVAAYRTSPATVGVTNWRANITAALVPVSAHVRSLESGDRAAFVSAFNRQLRAEGTRFQIRLNGERVEEGAEATTGVATIAAPSLDLPEAPEAVTYNESRVLIRMFIQKRNAENTAWMTDYVRLDNPSGTIAAGQKLLADWGVTLEPVDAGVAIESYHDGQYYRFRQDSQGRHAYTYRVTFNQPGRFRITGQTMVNGRVGETITPVERTVTRDIGGVPAIRNILAQSQMASRNRWNEVAGAPSGSRYYYDVANRRLHSYDGTSYRTLGANYVWSAASATRPDGIPAPS